MGFSDRDQQLESDPNQTLSEKDFIQNQRIFSKLPPWLWMSLILIMGILLLGTQDWYRGFLQKEKAHEPFLEVTNRDFSVFLWQFPSFLRNNVSKKTGYLPGFTSMHENFKADVGEEFVSAPPDLLFLYHTWNRLLAPEFISRPISGTEFSEFLNQLPEWQPENWKNAPTDYKEFIDSKKFIELTDLETLPETTLPMIVKRAFQGWKNYFKEGEQINALNPTFGEVISLLEKHPNYGRSYWRNIKEVYSQPIAGEQYLIVLQNNIEESKKGEIFPKDNLAPFIKVALFNAQQAALHK